MTKRFKVLRLGDFYRIYDYKKFEVVKNDKGEQYGQSALDRDGRDRADMHCLNLNKTDTTNDF